MRNANFTPCLITVAVFGLLFLLPVHSGAQSVSSDPAHDGDPNWGAMDYDKPLHSHVFGSELIGRNVVSPRGEALGFIDDIIIGLEGQVKYLIISRGGMLGIGDKRIVVPFAAVDQKAGGEADFMVDISPEDLARAPGYSEDERADFDDPEYEDRVRGYFDLAPKSP